MVANLRAAPERPDNAERTILVVEDDPEMRSLLTDVLVREGYRVVEAADGDDALEYLGPGFVGGQPDALPTVIVSDIWLPYCSGIEILEGTRFAPRRLPVVLITGFGDAETHRHARQLGAVCVLDKPFSMEALRAAVRIAVHTGEQDARMPPDGYEA